MPMTDRRADGKTTLDYARKYLQSDFAVVPLEYGSKRAVINGWQNLRLTSDDLPRYFDGKRANIGLLNGEPSGGLVNTDWDCAEARAAAPLLMPKTALRGGRSSAPESLSWYKVDQPSAKASEKFFDPTVVGRGKDAGLLLEIRSTGGQTVVPPSIYPAEPEKGHPTEEPCVWAEDGDPATATMADLRAAIVAVAAAALLGRHWPIGSRHDAALALAGGLLRAGWSVEKVETFLAAVCAAAGDDDLKDRLRAVRDTAGALEAGETTVTGWPTVEKLVGEAVVTQVITWLGITIIGPGPRATYGGGGKSNAAPPRYAPLPPFVPFPTDLLPGPWADLVREGATAVGCDESFLALPALTAIAGAIGNTRRIYLGRNWSEPAVVFACVVGDSSSLKSPAQAHVTDPVRDRQQQLIEEYQKRKQEYDDDLARWAEDTKLFKQKKGDDPGPKPEEPTLTRVYCSDTTIERLAELLHENPRGLLVIRDELSAWLGGFSRYKARGAGSDLPNWLEMHRAGPVAVDRKSGDRKFTFVPRAAVSVIGGIQPHILSAQLTPEFMASGLTARVLFAMPPRRSKAWIEIEVPAATTRAVSRSLDDLLALDFVTDESGKLKPAVVALSPASKKLWVAFYNEWAAVQAAAEGDLCAAFGKIEAYAARFALLHHVVTTAAATASTGQVSGESMAAGIGLAKWFAHETTRVYQMLAESAEERDTRRLVEHVRRHGGRITVKQLQRSNQRKYRTAEVAEADLEGLVGMGLGAWVISRPGMKGGRPTKEFVLCVTYDETDETPDSTDPGRGADDGPAGDETPGRVTEPDPAPQPPSPATPDFLRGSSESTGREEGVSSVSSYVTHNTDDKQSPSNTPSEWPEGFVTRPGVSSPAGVNMNDTLITDDAGLARVVGAVIAHVGPVGLDTETTGLDARRDRVRLLQLAIGPDVYLIDLFTFPDPAPALADLFGALAGRELVGHNLQFDLRMLAPLGFVPGRVFDTMLASQVFHAGERTKSNAPLRHGLDDVADRELGRTLDKTHQTADWSKPLTPAMLAYAATDAAVLVPLAEALVAKLAAAGLSATAEVEMRALPGVAWAAPVAVNRPVWLGLAAEAAAERGWLAAKMDALAPDPNGLPGMASRNWNSTADVAVAFAAVGVVLTSTDDDALAGVDHPLAEAMREYRSAAKRVGTYGRSWLDKHGGGDEVMCRWNQLGAESGRMSAAAPNLQQVPRGADYRKCFVARPGAVLVKADYSQIELRIAAKVADEPAMIVAYRRGDDLHALTAASVLGKPLDAVTKADRQLAKAVNFGLLFGMGWRGLRDYAKANYGVVLTDDEAQAYRAAFFRAYPELRRWHARVGGHVENLFEKNPDATHEARTLGDRRRLLPAGKGKAGSKYANVTEALNFPVQGTGADGLKAAIALLWERRAECPGAVPVLFCHDEIVLEVPSANADAAAGWLKRCMVDGMAPLVAPVPVDVEVTTGPTWGG